MLRSSGIIGSRVLRGMLCLHGPRSTRCLLILFICYDFTVIKTLIYVIIVTRLVVITKSAIIELEMWYTCDILSLHTSWFVFMYYVRYILTFRKTYFWVCWHCQCIKWLFLEITNTLVLFHTRAFISQLTSGSRVFCYTLRLFNGREWVRADSQRGRKPFLCDRSNHYYEFDASALGDSRQRRWLAKKKQLGWKEFVSFSRFSRVFNFFLILICGKNWSGKESSSDGGYFSGWCV